MVPNQPNEVHKAFLLVLPRHFSTNGDGDIVKVSCKIAVEIIQQMLTGLRPHRVLTVYGVSHSTESAVAISYHLHAVEKRPESTFRQGYRRGLLL